MEIAIGIIIGVIICAAIVYGVKKKLE